MYLKGTRMATSSIAIERTHSSRLAGVDMTNLPFGTVFSDHMVVADYAEGRWGPATVRPYAPLALPPSISALQYGLSVFEGLKAHRDAEGRVLLFRAPENAARLNRSAARLAMPEVPESLFLDSLRTLLDIDRDWVPPATAGALYIRPCLFAVDESLRVKPGERFAFLIATCPVGAYFTGATDVLVSETFVRAFPGGTGDIKAAGNYAAAFIADADAKAQGFSTVLWLDGLERRFVEECGVMNVFFVFADRIVTPALSGTILAGVTRHSVLTLLREMGHQVEERRVAIEEVCAAHDRGELREVFGTGTAATVSPVGRIRYRGCDLVLPPLEQRQVGPAVRERLVGIMTGLLPDPYGWVERL
jgi:branched-chain amino acid aminotransferase